MATALRNRRGRKRKFRARTSSGALVRDPAPDFRAMAASQPHRIGLPEAVRASEEAGSTLGTLKLLKRISGPENEAGLRYAQVVGAYLAVLHGPNGLGHGNGGYACDALACDPETCICKAREIRYMRTYEALAKAGRPAIMAVNEVAVRDRSTNDIPSLVRGLQALTAYFGLVRSART